MTPKGHLTSVNMALRSYRLRKDIVGLRAYLGSEEFNRHFLGIRASTRESIIEAAAATLAECKVRLPPPKRRSVKWWDEARIERLRRGVAAGWDDDQAALALGASPGAIYRARSRYLADTTGRQAA